MLTSATYLAKDNWSHIDVIKGVVASIDEAMGITGYASKNPQLIAAMLSHIDSELNREVALEFREYARQASEGLQGLGVTAVNGSLSISVHHQDDVRQAIVDLVSLLSCSKLFNQG